MSAPNLYKCGEVIESKLCGKQADAAYYGRRGWVFLCSSHVRAEHSCRKSFMWLAKYSEEELNFRALPRGEDR